MVNLLMASLVSFFFLGLTFFPQRASAHQSKSEVADAPFTYIDPNKWGSIEPDYKPCSSGKQQSPVDIITKTVVVNKTLEPLQENYVIRNASLMTNGLAVQLVIKGKSDLKLDGKPYRLVNIRWHVPSEHLIDGVRYNAEMHQVHLAHDDSVAIVSTLYKYGEPDPILTSLQPVFDKLAAQCNDKDDERKSVDVPLKDFSTDAIKKIPMDKYFTYQGSLTTPPCSNVTWFIISKVQTMSKEQVQSLSIPLGKSNKKNSRPSQAPPLDGIQSTS